jgi:hypothetical protein
VKQRAAIQATHRIAAFNEPDELGPKVGMGALDGDRPAAFTADRQAACNTVGSTG